MAQSFYMPMRGERTAPIFDSNRARDLPKAFTELERLFRRANITDDNEKKKHVVYYTDIDTEQIWQYIPEFDKPTSTYADFKNAIMEFYPEAAEFLYAITDIDSLTDESNFMGLVTYKRSIGSRCPSRNCFPAGPGLHCHGWPSVSSARHVSITASHLLYRSKTGLDTSLLFSFPVQGAPL